MGKALIKKYTYYRKKEGNLFALKKIIKYFLRKISIYNIIYCLFIRKKEDYYYNFRILNDINLAKKFKEHYLNNIKLSKNFFILDYGCGKGRFIGHLSLLGFKNLVGCDRVREKYWGNLSAIFFSSNTNNNYFLKNESFDLIFNSMVLTYIDPDNLESHFNEMSRVLRRKGYLIILERNDKTFNNVKNYMRKMGGYIHDINKIELLLRERKFKIISKSYEGIYFPILTKQIAFFRNLIIKKDIFDIMDFIPKNLFDKFLYFFIDEKKRGLILIKAQKY